MLKFLEKNPVFYLFAALWRFSAGNRSRVILSSFFSTLTALTSLVTPLILAKLLNTIQEQGVNYENFNFILFLLSLFIVQRIVLWTFHGFAKVLQFDNAFIARKNFQKFLLGGVLNLPLSWHTDHHSGDTIDKVNKGSNAIFSFAHGSHSYITNIVKFVGSVFALAYFDLISLWVVVGISAITAVIIFRFDRVLIPHYKILNKAYNKISEKIYDVIGNITTVVILRVEKLLLRDIMKSIMKPFGLYSKTLRLSELKWASNGILSSFMAFAVLGLYIWGTLTVGETVLIGTIVALSGYVSRINNVFEGFASLYSSAVRNRTEVSNAQELSDEFLVVPKRTGVRTHKNWKSLEIKNLNFSYHSVDEEKKFEVDLHLDDVNLSIRKGEKIAVIGESGSGKTTLLKVLRSLYIPNSVELLLDGKKLKSGIDAISNDIALIPQDPEIFTTTIKNNITIGLTKTIAEIRKYTDIARFSSVVDRLPKGLNSSIVERGVNLSGGEKQRLALARGLMASENKSILLLDEATSSVDPENEATIYESIFKTYEKKTVIASIHRLHLLRMFDTIYLFDNGKILTKGTFDQLLKSSKKFQKMWNNYTRTHKEFKLK